MTTTQKEQGESVLDGDVIVGQEGDHEAPEAKAPVLSDRERKMADLVAQREQEYIEPKEASTHPEVKTRHDSAAREYNNELDSQVNVDSPRKPVDNKRADADTASNKSNPVYEKDGVMMMKLKVKGEEIEMPLDKVQGIAQKNLYADVRLRNAAETEKSIQARERQVAEREQKLQESLAHPPRKDVEVTTEDVTVDAKTFIDTLFDGSREEAIEKAAQFLAHKNTAPVDQDALMKRVSEVASAQVLNEIRQRENVQRQQSFDTSLQRGLREVESRFPQLVQDDVLFDLVDRRTESISNANPNMSPEEVMIQAAQEISDRLGIAQNRQPAARQDDRQTRKAELKPVPRAAVSARHTVRQEPVVDMSPEAVLERMRRDRAGLGSRI